MLPNIFSSCFQTFKQDFVDNSIRTQPCSYPVVHDKNGYANDSKTSCFITVKFNKFFLFEGLFLLITTLVN